jgi:hypothetical protein
VLKFFLQSAWMLFIYKKALILLFNSIFSSHLLVVFVACECDMKQCEMHCNSKCNVPFIIKWTSVKIYISSKRSSDTEYDHDAIQ